MASEIKVFLQHRMQNPRHSHFLSKMHLDRNRKDTADGLAFITRPLIEVLLGP